MARLIYSAIASLDGYTADRGGKFDWSVPSEEVHAFVNDSERAVGTYLYGRRLYEVMAAWQDLQTEGEPAVVADYAQIWRGADKLVFSRSLDHVWTPKTELRHQFDSAAIRALKAAADRDISVGGAELAAEALRAGLVDEIRLFLSPIIVGGGTRALPDDVRIKLDLTDERRFANGVVHMAYRVVREETGP